MRVVARLCGKPEDACEGGSSLQFEAIAAARAVNRSLEIVSIVHGDGLSRAGSCGKSAVHIGTWQFGRAVKLPLLCPTLEKGETETQKERTGEFQLGRRYGWNE